MSVATLSAALDSLRSVIATAGKLVWEVRENEQSLVAHTCFDRRYIRLLRACVSAFVAELSALSADVSAHDNWLQLLVNSYQLLTIVHAQRGKRSQSDNPTQWHFVFGLQLKAFFSSVLAARTDVFLVQFCGTSSSLNATLVAKSIHFMHALLRADSVKNVSLSALMLRLLSVLSHQSKVCCFSLCCPTKLLHQLTSCCVLFCAVGTPCNTHVSLHSSD